MYKDCVSEVTNECNMEMMARYPDKFFDLAVVDPEYGIGASEMTMGLGKKKWLKGKNWDSNPPSNSYFDELFRVSKNQIIWGGNYFSLPVSRGWIFWDKDIRDGLSYSHGELAWTSFDKILKKVFIPYSGFRGSDVGGKIHPTQKPVALYSWIYRKYAKEGFKILDTHLGSGSNRIAAYDAGLDFYACEKDTDYFNDQEKRFKQHISQLAIF